MLLYETYVLLFWYSLWNLLDEFYQQYFDDEEMSTQKYTLYNIAMLIVAIMMYLYHNYSGKSFKYIMSNIFKNK